MILGMSVSTFTLVHVLLSLIGIFAGLIVVYGFLKGRLLDGWNGVFLVTTILTSVTGFLFHSAQFGPPHFVGIIPWYCWGSRSPRCMRSIWPDRGA
jgi:hypothetical protein